MALPQIKDIKTLEATTPFTVLGERQRLYVLARMQGLTPLHAVKAIGVDKSQSQRASQLEKHPKVRAALQWLAQQDRPEITRDAVLDGFMDSVHSAGTSAELTMAWREIGKILGVYAPETVEIKHTDVTTERLKQMSDKDLLKFLGKTEFNHEVENVYDAEFEVLSTGVKDPEPIERDAT